LLIFVLLCDENHNLINIITSIGLYSNSLLACDIKRYANLIAIYIRVELEEMFKISLDNFRGFHKQKFVEIRPMTILVGENSAGKSSFLAAVKYAMDFSAGGSTPSFNKDPFQLGTYHQIAHYRGGSAGRARSFSIRLQLETVSFVEEDEPEIPSEILDFTLVFDAQESQAVVSIISVRNKKGLLSTYFSSGDLVVEYTAKNKSVYRIKNKGFSITRSAGFDLIDFWPFYMRQLGHFKEITLDGKKSTQIPDKISHEIEEISEQAARCVGFRPGYIEATSAIRTKPLRTYTPGLEVRDGEGSHVPMELAKLYRSRNKESWNKLKKSIEDFGKTSEMFKEISVKSFGKSVSDPFQIQFSSDGPKTNIIDLGYGTSQVIPILYSIAIAAEKSSFLIQQPEVHLHPRAQAALGEYFIQGLRSEGKKFILETHSDFIVDRIRKSVSDGLLSPNQVSILFFERKKLENTITPIELDLRGEPINPPKAYRSFFTGEQLHMFGL